jgi:ABC-type dipeptide/oligopeptide/nickel transport system permease component
MLRFIARRLLQMVPVLFVIETLTFVMMISLQSTLANLSPRCSN